MTETRDEYVRTARIVIAGIFALTSAPAQTPTQSRTSGQSPALLYVNPAHLPSNARAYLSSPGRGRRVQAKSGTTLTGVYSGFRAGATQATLVWQVPGNIRFEIANRPGPPIIYNTTAGLIGADKRSSAEASFLESLLDDPVEAFLYSFEPGKCAPFHRWHVPSG